LQRGLYTGEPSTGFNSTAGRCGSLAKDVLANSAGAPMISHEVHDAPAEGWRQHGIAKAVQVQHHFVVAELRSGTFLT